MGSISVFVAIISLAGLNIGNALDKEFQSSDLTDFGNHTTTRLTRRVNAVSKENKTIDIKCSFILVHDNKTVFINNRPISTARPIKPKFSKAGRIKPKSSTAGPILTSQVFCTPDKTSATVIDFEIHSRPTDSFTMTTFTLTLTTNPNIIKSATVRVTKLINGQEIIGKLGLSLNLDKLKNLTPDVKKQLNETLTESILQFEVLENKARLVKSKRPFIQFTEKTDQLGQNARLFATITATDNAFEHNTTEGGLERDLDELTNILSENCQHSRDGFEGTDPSNVACDPCDNYRKLDGVCNNLNNTDFGAAGIPMRRLLPNAYNDGFSIPRGGFSSRLPSPRLISAMLHHRPPFPSTSGTTPLTSKGFTHMAMQFGQFLDHDITLSAQQELDCCDPDFMKSDQNVSHVLRRCFNIDVNEDPFYQSRNVNCHSFTRSDFICTNSDVREQINGITAFIDASNVYGSDTGRASQLRVGEGKLKENTAQAPGHLPTRSQCGLPGPGNNDDLVAGDVRANNQPTLASIHTLFLNEHNRIATELKAEADMRGGSFLTGILAIKQDNIIYEETRKIVGATIQNIVYDEYVPIIVGSAEVAAQGLGIVENSEYDDTLDPSIVNEFATVAYRFGHSLIDGVFNRHLAPWSLRDHYFDNFLFVLDNQWKKEMDGVTQQQCPARDLSCTHDVTNFLFRDLSNAFTNIPGDDLIARNIQRGRDHGIPSYRKLREFCNLSDLPKISPPPEINSTVWNNILEVYSNVDDIDAFTGGLAEEAPDDGLVGPTFACIIGKQFKRLMLGDRFFFTHTSGSDHVRGLQPKSKATIRKRTLGDIICDNARGIGGIRTSPTLHVMLEASASNRRIKCEDREPLDISGIVDDIEAVIPCTLITTSSITVSTTLTIPTTVSTTPTTPTTISTTLTIPTSVSTTPATPTTVSTTLTIPTTVSTTPTTVSTTPTTQTTVSTTPTTVSTTQTTISTTPTTVSTTPTTPTTVSTTPITISTTPTTPKIVSTTPTTPTTVSTTPTAPTSVSITPSTPTTVSTTPTNVSTTPTTKDLKPLPGYCATKSSDIVDKDQEWIDGCLDLKGNLYAQDQYLISCCGCFKILCNSFQPSVYSRRIVDKVFSWNKILEPQCCQDCHGKVFNAGSVMNTEVLDDNCSTTVNTKCVFIGQENRAITEMSYSHRNCCSDETGLHPIGTAIDIPKTCSTRTCYRKEGQMFSAWRSNQVLSGCNCCSLSTICSETKGNCSVHDRNMVEDGGVLIIAPGYPHKPRNLKCYEGKFLEEIQSG